MQAMVHILMPCFLRADNHFLFIQRKGHVFTGQLGHGLSLRVLSFAPTENHIGGMNHEYRKRWFYFRCDKKL